LKLKRINFLEKWILNKKLFKGEFIMDKKINESNIKEKNKVNNKKNNKNDEKNKEKDKKSNNKEKNNLLNKNKKKIKTNFNNKNSDEFSTCPDFFNDSYTIYICGVGGQGIIKTSVIIGDAAIKQGLNVVMSEIHGMSQRGGVVSTELKIGKYKSSIIEKSQANMILGFEPIEVIRSLDKANSSTKIVFNNNPIIPPNINSQKNSYPNVENVVNLLKKNYEHVYNIDGDSLAIESGNILSLNMVLLGAATANDSFPLSKKDIILSMKDNLKPKFHEMNLNAIERGFNAVNSLKSN
jgi:indolepyruvate ferredoxin oxidoreductase beta subunit